MTLSREKESLQAVAWRHHWTLEPAPKSTTNYPRAPVGITRKKDRACVVRWQRQWGYIYFCDMVFFRCFLYIGYLSMLLVCLMCLVGGRCLLIRRLHVIFRTQQHPIWPTMLSLLLARLVDSSFHAITLQTHFCQTGAMFSSCLWMSIHVLDLCFVRSKYTYLYF